MLGKKLEALGACREAVEWSAQYGDDFQRAWNECHRGDWMLWLLGKLSGTPESDSRKKLVLACCEVARTALPIFEVRYPNDSRPRKAIETAESYANSVDGVTLDDVLAAAADAAADAADAAAYAAADAADARAKSLAACVDIVRKHYPIAPTFPK